MFVQTGKGFLMQRMGSPNLGDKDKSISESINMGSTMAGTSNLGTKYRFSISHTSPFRETVARGMVTGVGLLGK